MEAYQVRTILDELLDASDANAAIWALAQKATDETAEPFERYAGSALMEAGAAMACADSAPPIRIRRIADGQLVRLFASGYPPGAKPAFLQIVEDALNRLLGVRDAMENGLNEQGVPADPNAPSVALRQKYAQHGAAYPLWSDPTRGSHVKLPPRPSSGKPTLAYFNEIDWRMLDHVASIAHLYYQSALLVNKVQVIFSVKGLQGSEWDVRTRLASSLGNLWVSLGLSLRFDCDLSQGLAVVRFSMPTAESFPAYVAGERAGELEAVGNRIGDAVLAYTYRYAALLASACFGAGRTVEHALVIGEDAQSPPVVSCRFNRRQFVRETLPIIDSGELSSSELRFQPAAIQRLLGMEPSALSHETPRTPVSALLQSSRTPPQEDLRILPNELQTLFHAKRIRDIDVSHQPSDKQPIIEEALGDAHTFAMSAIASLETLADDLERSLDAPEDQSSARPLHCETALQRLGIALLDEELRIGADAEAFLSFEEAERTALPDVYYYRAPSALFPAHAGLADLYRHRGDYPGVEKQADRCIALAPTMPTGYVLKAEALSKTGKTNEAVNVVLNGLNAALSDDDRALLLHNLALLVRRIGKQRESEALLLVSASLSGSHAAKSLEIVRDIADGVNVQAFLHANLEHAKGIVRNMGVVTDIERVRNTLIARAALGLVNAHAPNAAAPYAALLAKRFPTNHAILSACSSIQHGLEG